MKILRAGQHRRMPWKNGGGETTEIMAFPEGSGLDQFGWRLSMARVASDGPFSHFPEVDRTLCVIEGEGLALAVASQAEIVLTQASAPFCFPGDVAVTSRLVKGPITDLNVMSRRGRWSHKVTRLCVEGSREIERESGVTLLLSRSQRLALSGTDGPEMLDVDDAALFGGACNIRLDPTTGNACAFIVELRTEVG
ncbi:MAG: HutD family protein [Hyphomicrobiales bacterium]|nr:HutD family protein [Hyphomicrobiales bacterium]